MTTPRPVSAVGAAHLLQAFTVTARGVFTPVPGQPQRMAHVSFDPLVTPECAEARWEGFTGGWLMVAPHLQPTDPRDVAGHRPEIHSRVECIYAGGESILVLTEGTTPSANAYGVSPVPGAEPYDVPADVQALLAAGRIDDADAACFAGFEGWMVHIVRPVEVTFVLRAPVVERRGDPAAQPARQLGTLDVTVRMERSAA